MISASRVEQAMGNARPWAIDFIPARAASSTPTETGT